MASSEISFCLEIISDFPSIREEIDKSRLFNKISKLMKDEDEFYHLILISGYLMEMEVFFPEILNE